MRLTSGELDAFLPKLSNVAVVGLRGESETDLSEVARRLIQSELGPAGESFRLTSVETCDSAGLQELLSRRPLGGGRGVVWVAEAAERLAGVILAHLGGVGGEALLLLGLRGRVGTSGLANAIASSPSGAVVDCTATVTAAKAELSQMLASLDVAITPDALALLLTSISHRGQSRASAACALALMVGPGGVADASAVRELTGEAESAALGAALRLGLAGDPAALDKAVGQALTDGLSGVGLVRQALASLRFGGSGGGSARMERAAATLWTAERVAKRTGYPQDLIAAEAVRGLGRG